MGAGKKERKKYNITETHSDCLMVSGVRLARRQLQQQQTPPLLPVASTESALLRVFSKWLKNFPSVKRGYARGKAHYKVME